MDFDKQRETSGSAGSFMIFLTHMTEASNLLYLQNHRFNFDLMQY